MQNGQTFVTPAYRKGEFRRLLKITSIYDVV
jgi:hypothetical protein